MTTIPTNYKLDADGTKFIAATQRPDGTWRKPRRVKEGYVPQEEVPLYESKGKQFKARQNTGLPVGLTPEIVALTQKQKKTQSIVQPIPGMIINIEKKKKKKKKTGVEDVIEKMVKCEIQEPTYASPSCSSISDNPITQTDPIKRLKHLRKKLRDIEALEEKLKVGILKTLDKDQKEKILKKCDILQEISQLEERTSPQ